MTDLPLKRIAISVEYDGTHYCGWQEQKSDSQVVQTKVQNALSKIAHQRIRIICSGRTDARVNASSQICHFDTYADRKPYNWVVGTNTQLPEDIALTWAHEVDDKFHARFAARSRQYVYLIRCLPFRSALLRHVTTFSQNHLDASQMAKGGAHLVGKHDFSAYRSAKCQAKTSVRTLMRLSVHVEDELIAIHIEANGFLQNMVRNIVGVLITIGAGEKPADWARDVLLSLDRTKGGVTAPPQGLYFLGSTYSDTWNLPETIRVPTVLKGILKTNPVQ